MLRDHLGSYTSSDSSSSYGALVIPESTFDDVVAVVAVLPSPSPCAMISERTRLFTPGRRKEGEVDKRSRFKFF